MLLSCKGSSTTPHRQPSLLSPTTSAPVRSSSISLYFSLFIDSCLYINVACDVIELNKPNIENSSTILFSLSFSTWYQSHFLPLHFFQNIASFSKPPDLLKPNTDRGIKFLAKNPIQNKQSQTVYLKPFSSITTQSFEFIKTL